MGLDMYAMITRQTPHKPVDFEVTEDICGLHYWRKHPNFHGWMENLYYKKGGTEIFNSVPVQLVLEDLRQLEQDINAGKLPTTTGFFFGKSQGDERDDDLAFVKKAREAIADGYTVLYHSWW